MTDVAVYTAAAPVFAVESQTVPGMGRDLVRLDVAEGHLGLRTLVARFLAVGPDSDGSPESLSYLDGRTVDLGSAISATIGEGDEARQVFRGTVSALEVAFAEGGYPVVSVLAEDTLMRLRMTDRNATYVDVTDGDLLSQIADQHGLGAVADVEGHTYPVVQQMGQSDLAFLRQRASHINAELWVDADDVLHLADQARRDGPQLDLVQGNDLIAVTGRADLADQRTVVAVRGWDRAAVGAVDEEASADVVKAEVAGGGRIGPDVVTDVFGQLTLARLDREASDAPRAMIYAEAEMKRRARSFVTVDGTTAGTPDLVPGAHLTLHRVGKPFAGGGYRVIHVHHSYDLTVGYRTSFTAQRAEVAP